jgi:hypothetical protein
VFLFRSIPKEKPTTNDENEQPTTDNENEEPTTDNENEEPAIILTIADDQN